MRRTLDFLLVGLAIITCLAFVPACGMGMTAADHQRELPQYQEPAITLGTFQSKVKVGMSQGDVAAAVGSPNIVSNDADGADAWIYDKISSESAYSSSSSTVSGGLGVVAFPLPVAVGGAVGGSSSKASGASISTQKTLTVVIKFDKAKKVKSMNYHASKF